MDCWTALNFEIIGRPHSSVETAREALQYGQIVVLNDSAGLTSGAFLVCCIDEGKVELWGQSGDTDGGLDASGSMRTCFKLSDLLLLAPQYCLLPNATIGVPPPIREVAMCVQ